MPNVWRTLLTLWCFATMTQSAFAASYLYVIDTSSSMGRHRPLVLDAITRDLERGSAAESPFYQAGDRIILWTFGSEVTERWRVEYTPDSVGKLRAQLEAQWKRLRWNGTTSLAKPLTRVLEEFRGSETGTLHLVVYTDAGEAVSAAQSETICRMYNHSLAIDSRLAHAYFVQFGKEPIPDETTRLIEALGGKLIGHTQSRELRAPPTPAPGPLSVVSIEPTTLAWVAVAAPEILKAIPVEFQVEPPTPGLTIGLNLAVTNLPSGMSIATTADHLATEGKQSISFLIRNAAAGQYHGVLQLLSSAQLRPGTLPVHIEIRPPEIPIQPAPDTVGIRLVPDPVPMVTLTASSSWQKVPNLALSLFYPEALKDAPVQFKAEPPPGIEIQLLPGGDAAKAVAAGAMTRLSEIGGSATFQIRQVAPETTDKAWTANLSFEFAAGRKLKWDGAERIGLPFRFVSPVQLAEVRIDSPEIALGTVSRSAKSAAGVLNLQINGNPRGSKLRILKQGNGLDGLSITPEEILLQPGALSVDLRFGGFENRSSGKIDGAFVLTPADASFPLRIKDNVILVRGEISASLAAPAEVENSFVAGQPFFIRARPHLGGQTPLKATVRPPDSSQDHVVSLLDDGSPDSGDAKANDGIYSGAFRGTANLGKYQVNVSVPGTNESAASITIITPIYFKAPAEPFTGKLATRNRDGLVEFKAQVVSSYPERVAIRTETSPPQIPLTTYFSTKALEPGENTLTVLVGLTPESQPGEYKYQLNLVADPIENAKASIPIFLEVRVLSSFDYLIRLVVGAIAFACVVFIAIVAPWRKMAFLHRFRRTRAVSVAATERPFRAENEPPNPGDRHRDGADPSS